LNGVTDITGKGLEYLKPLSLHTLSLSSIVNITDEGVKKLSSIRSLTLCCKNITDKGLKSILNQCQELETLVIYDGENLTDESFTSQSSYDQCYKRMGKAATPFTF
jgi:hypothetical protein